MEAVIKSKTVLALVFDQSTVELTIANGMVKGDLRVRLAMSDLFCLQVVWLVPPFRV